MEANLLFDRLINKNESNRLDFKEVFHGTRDSGFIHDLLSLYNTPIKGEKYLIFGVSDDKEIKGLDAHIESSDVNNFLASFPLNKMFFIQVVSLIKCEKKISIIIIPENNYGPIVPKSDKSGLKKNHVYTRNGDTNIGKSETSPPDVIKAIYDLVEQNYNQNLPQELVDLDRRSVNSSFLNSHDDIHKLFHMAVRDYKGWGKSIEYNGGLNEDVETYYYKTNMNLTISVTSHLDDFREPWAQDALDPKAFSYFVKLNYKGIKIDETLMVLTDGAREKNIVPNQLYITSGEGAHYYYYLEGSLKHDLNSLVNNGLSSHLDRTGMKQFPVFKSEEIAKEIIENDFKSGDRLYLSYTAVEAREERFGMSLRKYKKYPHYLDGKAISAKSKKITKES